MPSRWYAPGIMDMRKLAETDPLHRNVDKDAGGDELSPMEPPDAYAPPATVALDYDALHPFLKRVVDDHRNIGEQLGMLETALAEIEKTGMSPEAGAVLTKFFAFMDAEITPHHRREERKLFPLLRERLIASGEHAGSADKRTGVDVLEDDHVKDIQHTAAACAFIGLFKRLPDPDSGKVALAWGVRQCRVLVEHLRLHIFREENIIFGLAQQHLSRAELDRIAIEQG